jgi:hypothetical protein
MIKTTGSGSGYGSDPHSDPHFDLQCRIRIETKCGPETLLLGNNKLFPYCHYFSRYS